MKRLTLVLVAILCAFALNAQKITLLHEGDTPLVGQPWPTLFSRAAALIQERYPGVTVELIQGTLQGAVDMTLETMIASGNAPNVVAITVMRSSKLFKAGQAIDLKQYIPADLKKYEPAILARTTRDGHVYALPQTVAPLGLSVNVSLAEEVGFKLPAPGSNWTMAQFMEFARLAKTKGKYGTVLFSGSNPIPYVTAWFTSFGVEFFKGNDYSKVTINSPQMRAALAWLKDMVAKGYAAPNASQLIDDDMVSIFAEGKSAAQPIFPDFLGEIGAKVKAGAIPEAFKSAWYPFPLAPGVKSTGTFLNYGAVVAMDKKDKRLNQIGAELAVLCSDEGFQKPIVTQGSGVASIVGMANTNTARNMQQLADVVNKYGAYDMGGETPKYSAFRPVLMPLLAQFFDGKIDAEKLIKDYEKAANEALQ